MAAQSTTFEAWRESIPERVRSGPLWVYAAYPKHLLLYELVWGDSEQLLRDLRGRAIAEQIIRSAGSISANTEEGYGRGLGLDYPRFLGFALGSARETQGWYLRARHPENRIGRAAACIAQRDHRAARNDHLSTEVEVFKIPRPLTRNSGFAICTRSTHHA